MNKTFAKILMIIVVFGFLSVNGYADSQIQVKVGKEIVEFDISPIIKEEKVYLPIRELFDLFGFDVEWVGVLREVIGSKKDIIINMKAGSNIVTISGDRVQLSETSLIHKDRFYAPIEFIELVLKSRCNFDYDNKVVDIWTDNNYSVNIEGDGNLVLALGDNTIINITKRYGMDKLNDAINDVDKYYPML